MLLIGSIGTSFHFGGRFSTDTMILSIGTNTKRLSINNYNALKISVACLFRESLHSPFTPRVAVAVVLWATPHAAILHLHCSCRREAATKSACANIQNSRRACDGSSVTIPCSSSHFVHTSGGNCWRPTQCMPHLWRSHRRQIRSMTSLLVDM